MKQLIFLSFLTLSTYSIAAVLPTPQAYDYRITEVKYNPQDVINVRAGIGTSTLIQLESGEKVLREKEGLMLGDAMAWGFEVNENNIFFKPTVINPDSNLILVTNKHRTYTFYLTQSDFPHYIVKMVYDKPKSARDYDSKIPCFDGTVNFNYEKWGDDELSPNYMWDDGRFTCLKFINNSELPVAYQVASDGTESMINYNIAKDTMILHGTSKEFRLRLGGQVLGLRSNDTVASGHNEKATSVNAKRELKNE
ncbi:conjugal transfer protein TraH [Vibrio cyclitrophicus 1F175]|uniref:TrbG/VirB9 family P-type conjugative transfer protein n=1 Tax=Vibrio cyclitrophicus TaxID=47951 RepID=UPI0002F3C3E9|nr:TrbG/VirB9 family P-type conjugative transfer protein [Vibrio cyclitrophicus]OEF63572.1 conjugal transfer protein TraH [Vibrio cyclitrophicus 1F175]